MMKEYQLIFTICDRIPILTVRASELAWRLQKDLHLHIRAFNAPALRVKLQSR